MTQQRVSSSEAIMTGFNLVTVMHVSYKWQNLRGRKGYSLKSRIRFRASLRWPYSIRLV